MGSPFYDMTKILKPCTMGNYVLEDFTIPPNDFQAMRQGIPAGHYMRLYNQCGFGSVIMSNTPMEERTNRAFVRNAFGDVLVAGLGLGMIILPAQEKPDVKSITVVELSPEVIQMVGSQLPLNSKVTIVNANCHSFVPPQGMKYDTIYLDIWGDYSSDTWQEMKKLKAYYRKYKKSKAESPNAFISCWVEDEVHKLATAETRRLKYGGYY